MAQEQFYRELPRLDGFQFITDLKRFQAVPDSWLILLTDIRGSTKAIEEGRYKDVNLVGASTIIAVLNAAGEAEVPFVFGGDGATILIPPSLEAPCRAALLASRGLAREAFGLELRIGVVPVSRVAREGHPVLVAKVGVSPHYEQAMFAGGGLARAEKLVKDPALNAEFLVPESNEGPAGDFTGLECRWSDIRVPRARILSLLVAARGASDDVRSAAYARVLHGIEEIFGDVDALRPVTRKSLRLSFSPKRLWAETKIRTRGAGVGARLKYLVQILLGNVLGLWLLRERKSPPPPGTGEAAWAKYPAELLRNTDSKKFDDTLRMILSANEEQERRLRAFLEAERAQGRVHYGIHAADHALMTCLVFDRKGRHIHFVDGGDGGYAAAARQLKEQLASK